jgi:TMEM175 potassium channel family protein
MVKKHSKPPVDHHEPSADLKRVIALSDGIFAIALTLLALDLRLPDIPNLTVQNGLAGLLPKLLVFLLSFLIIGNQWDVHQRTFLHISRADAKFALLNLVSLFFVILLPAAAAILGRYPTQPLAIICFGVNSALLGLSSWLAWSHASGDGHLLDDQADPRLVAMISRLWFSTPVVFFITIPLVFLNVYLVYILWLILPAVSYLSIGIYMRQVRSNRP